VGTLDGFAGWAHMTQPGGRMRPKSYIAFCSGGERMLSATVWPDKRHHCRHITRLANGVIVYRDLSPSNTAGMVGDSVD
jgi:hypothetical protein